MILSKMTRQTEKRQKILNPVTIVRQNESESFPTERKLQTFNHFEKIL